VGASALVRARSQREPSRGRPLGVRPLVEMTIENEENIYIYKYLYVHQGEDVIYVSAKNREFNGVNVDQGI